ncbi:MAG: metalloregulator ArsR/SmtB family transcription factor [Candidatus Humimicrobiaceae bacterium]
MERLSQICNMLADKNRLRILKLLEYKPMCVCELTHIIGIRQPSISRHLRKLKEANLIDSRQDGQWHEYFINRRGDEYSRILMGNLSGWINEDSIIVEDIKRAGQTCRESLCRKLER